MKLTPIPAFPCPNCGKEFDCAVPTFSVNAQPKEGRLSICTFCGVLGQFTADLTVRLFPPEDFSLLPIELRNEIKLAQVAIRLAREIIEGEREKGKS